MFHNLSYRLRIGQHLLKYLSDILHFHSYTQALKTDHIPNIFMEQGKFVKCEVQGRASDSSEFKFDPTGWHKPTYSTLTSAS